MYKRILVPVKEPSEVEPMIRFASSLLDTDGEIRILHIIPTTTLPEVAREWRASVNIVIPAHEAGAALDVKVEPEVRAATDVPAEILECAENEGVEAIVLTLQGNRRSHNPFVGHTASGILHHASADVLIVNRLALAADHIPAYSSRPCSPRRPRRRSGSRRRSRSGGAAFRSSRSTSGPGGAKGPTRTRGKNRARGASRSFTRDPPSRKRCWADDVGSPTCSSRRPSGNGTGSCSW